MLLVLSGKAMDFHEACPSTGVLQGNFPTFSLFVDCFGFYVAFVSCQTTTDPLFYDHIGITKMAAGKLESAGYSAISIFT